MLRRRKQPAPVPPPIGGVLIDGSNVIASSDARPVERIDLAVAWAQSWRPDLPVSVFLDQSTWNRCRPAARQELELRAKICERGREADVELLQRAAEQSGLILSNDRFWDHEELRSGVITVQFVLRSGELRVYDQATWFPSARGAAVVVPMEVLQRG